ncbi:NUDIX domain-containing protein, partial [Streptomyces sp. YS-3]
HQPHPPARGAVPDLNGKRDRFRPAVDTATVLHRPDGRVLLLRRTEPAADRRLVLVGGALTGSEWADDSARRAVDAAVGVQVDASDVEYCGTAHLQVGDGERYLVLLFTAQRWRGEPRNAGSQGEVELVWAEPGEPPADCHPATAALLDLFVTGTLQTCLRVPATRERGTA